MFNRILAAIDMSKAGQRVFGEALNLAKANRASLMLVHVLSPDEEGCPDIEDLYKFYYPAPETTNSEHYQELWEQFSQKGLECLRSYSETAIAAGVQPEYKQVPGSPGKTICKTAGTWNADLIVIGRRGLSGLNEAVMGSVSNYVIHHAHCSILTVQSQVRTVTESMPIATH